MAVVITRASLASYRYVEAPLRRARWAETNQATLGIGIASGCLLAGILPALLSQSSNFLYTGKRETPFNLEKLSAADTEITVANCGTLNGEPLKKISRNRGMDDHLYICLAIIMRRKHLQSGMVPSHALPLLLRQPSHRCGHPTKKRDCDSAQSFRCRTQESLFLRRLEAVLQFNNRSLPQPKWQGHTLFGWRSSLPH